MERAFRNPANGHTERVGGWSWLAVLIFGAFYLAYKGLWGHFFIWLLLVGGFSVLTGGPGLIIALPLASIGYAIGINSILTNFYLRKGWVEVSGDSPSAQTSDLRDCPFCAETIKCAAIKCKHCGADVEAVAIPALTDRVAGATQDLTQQTWALTIPCRKESDRERAATTAEFLKLPSLLATDSFFKFGPYPSKTEAGAVLRQLTENGVHGNIEEIRKP